ncbi:cohesin complex subunit [Pyricularia oryzae]
MESADVNATASPGPDPESRRSRSGRVVRAPSKFTPEATPAPSGAGKRKRPNGHDDTENDAPSSDDELSDPEEVDEDGDEHDDDPNDEDADAPRPRKRNNARSNGKSKKPATKKPKINGSGLSHSASIPSRPKKAAPRISIANGDDDSLYADVFGSGNNSDDVAGRWYTRYTQNQTEAVTDLVNCVLRSAGCDQEVNEDDINDPDNCPNRLAELQSLYEDRQLADYPLIAKSKTTRSFRSLLVDFFKSLLNVLHETETLYEDEVLMENIVRWVGSMSSSTLRPFRHTATTIALSMHHSLVYIARKVDERITKATQQLEAEQARLGQRKDKAGRQKLTALQESLDQASEHRAFLKKQMDELFDTVFIHRYRDVDVRIRVECVEALGNWTFVLPTVYIAPNYLRYLGWLLSDTAPQARQEVLKQLARILKRDAEKIGHFIERFRPRLVEICTKDSDVGVRVAAIGVIDCLRESGNLQPDDIDQIGKLIIDSEVRIRKAVADFFIHGIEDSIESRVQDIGGTEAIEEMFDDDQDAYDSPREDWIKVKCLAELLTAYTADEEPVPHRTLGLEIATDVVDPTFSETRITLAAQALFEKMPEISNWEIIAGYLLFDHSVRQTSKSRSKAKPTEAAFRTAVAPEGQEETTLLEVLAAAVQLNLAQNGEQERLKKRPGRTGDGEAGEGTAVHLAEAIPRLLKKYGAEANTAKVVLGLHRHLDLEVFLQLRQDSTTYSRLLDEICAQFLRHADTAVIFQATRALLQARRHEELQELVERKMEDLWQHLIGALRRFDQTTELSVRGNLEENALLQLITLVMKISKLASISACVPVLEADGDSDESRSPPIQILVNMVHRGKLGEVNDDIDNIEDEVTIYTIKACHFYFMWKAGDILKAIKGDLDISNDDIDRLSDLRKTYDNNLVHTFSSRGAYDELRLFALGNYCDLQTLCAAIGLAVSGKKNEASSEASKYAGLQVLVQEVKEAGLVSEIIAIYNTAERLYAMRAKKTLGEPAHDDDPQDDDMLSDDENEADATRTDEGRKAAELRAEKNLCDIAGKLIMCVRAGMMDRSGPRAGRLKRRLLRNQHRLGQNLKAVLAYLDESKGLEDVDKKKSRPKGKQPAKDGASGKQQLSEAIVVEDDIEDDDEDLPEEGTVEDLRRRELIDDPIEDEPQDEDEDEGGGGGADDAMDEDSVIGD